MQSLEIAPWELRRLHGRCRVEAARLEQCRHAISRLLREAPWDSEEAGEFQGRWVTEMSPAMEQISAALSVLGAAAGEAAVRLDPFWTARKR